MKHSPWKTDREVPKIPPEEFKFEVAIYEVLRITDVLKRMTPSPQHAFFILLATMLHMAEQNGVSKEELTKILTEEILAHKVAE